MQHKITEPSDLLNTYGELVQTGYATSPLLTYKRENAAYKLRLKEWDYYLIYNEDSAFALTLANISHVLLISATVIDLKKYTVLTKNTLKIVSGWVLPESSLTGDINYRDDSVSLSIVHEEKDRVISLYSKNFTAGSDLTASIRLSNEPEDSMVAATPFVENEKYFYYNRKVIGMTASGYVNLKNTSYSYLPSTSFGLLDWGRGLWPYKTTWYWSAAQGFIADNVFGFNLGYGFGDTTDASENMLFLNGKASKLSKVKFHIPKNSSGEYEYKKPWTITSDDNRIDLSFEPLYDRNLDLSALLFATSQHQVFGKFTGAVVTDDGSSIYIHDFLGFAERVKNRW